MTTLNTMIGAPLTEKPHWSQINWNTVRNSVRRMQLRIAKAIKQKRYGKAKALQWLLTHSFHTKLMAVKRVTQNSGSKTPGVDGITWKTEKQKMKAVYDLKRRGYKAQPLRRIYIFKSNGKKRPLGIPTMADRAQQALQVLALQPAAEILADKNSYGFRPKRSIHDAIEQCFINLARKGSAQWILEGDIKACFDKISHQWMKQNIQMDQCLLKQWLQAGYMEKDMFYDTKEGTPQGGIASPVLANIVLDGMEEIVKSVANKGDKVNFVRYADDFICTAASKEILEEKVQPVIIKFLKERGLDLSLEKTLITHIDKGFDFLGFNVRKYNDKLLIKPSKKGIKKFLDGIRETIKSMRGTSTASLIKALNPKIRGWANNCRHVVSKDIFTHVDSEIFHAIWRWAKHRHPKKSSTWLYKKYFTTVDNNKWCLFDHKTKDKQGKFIMLAKASNTPIKRHIKIRGEATPYDPEYQEYFRRRYYLLKKK